AAPYADAEGSRWASYVTAHSLLALGRPAEALAQTERHLQWSRSIEAERLRAQALLAMGDRAQALDAVRTLVARQPDAVSAQTAAGDVLLAAGALDEA